MEGIEWVTLHQFQTIDFINKMKNCKLYSVEELTSYRLNFFETEKFTDEGS